jgi:hypothetical protein
MVQAIDSIIGLIFMAQALIYIPAVFAGGFVAYRKGDFFSRGVAITAFTNIFGLIFMLKAPPSRARTGDENDIKNWHIHGAIGGLCFIAFNGLFVLLGSILNQLA